ncbi:hypothetical protein [Kitasatospora sp. NPDC090091]|uniref:hypothetical protein n=1 Tax=Kitasatospora sp. NPDC090091 TaxID=3364081 RepID=UPI00380DBF06
MADEPPTPTAGTTEPLTVHTALEHAARLLLNAELVTDHSLMARLESMADSWNSIARTLIADRDGRDD